MIFEVLVTSFKSSRGFWSAATRFVIPLQLRRLERVGVNRALTWKSACAKISPASNRLEQHNGQDAWIREETFGNLPDPIANPSAGALGRSTVGIPRAPARCATGVSTLTSKSRDSVPQPFPANSASSMVAPANPLNQILHRLFIVPFQLR